MECVSKFFLRGAFAMQSAPAHATTSTLPQSPDLWKQEKKREQMAADLEIASDHVHRTQGAATLKEHV